MRRRTCAAITLSERGGGVAAVARLAWGAMRARWRDDARLVTLAASDDAVPDFASRVTFGSKLAAGQALGDSAWVLYTHLALAQVQQYIPSRLQSPYAIFLHGIEVWRDLSRAQRAALQGARVLIANSSYTARRARAAHPWLPPILVCELALEHDTSPDLAPRPSLQQTLTVLIVGRLAAAERYKGHDELIDVWPSIQQACPGARLVIAGDGDDRARLETKARDLTTAGLVEFTGFVTAERLDDLYRAADIFAMPSRNEGFGLVYLEAMRHALPCVGSVHDAAAEVIESGVTGLLVDPDQPPSLESALVRLGRDPALRSALGRRGAERLAQRFSKSRFETQLCDALDLAFDEARARPASGVEAAAL